MWIATDSGTIYPVLIEIEAPAKKWFNRDGTQTATFSQAQNQLTEWRMWFNEPRNQMAFLAHYDPPHAKFRRLLPQFVLIYGRRSEFEKTPHLAAKRQHLQRPDEHYMSFDRLEPIATSDQYMTVDAKADGFHAHSIPPTIELGPRNADHFAKIAGKEEAIENSVLMSEPRRKFLQRRFSYWDSWARAGARGLQSLGDRE